MALPALTLSTAPALAQEAIARVVQLTGSAFAMQPGAAARALAIDQPLYASDRVETAVNSLLRLAFTDGTITALGASAAMVIENYRREVEEPAFSARVLRGAFRFVTGAIARSRANAFGVSAVASTIGVRGTHFGGEVEGVAVTVVLLEPEEKGVVGAIEVSNPFGSVVIDQPGFGTEIPDEVSPPGPVRRMQLRAVENLLRSIQSIPRVPRGIR